MEYQKNLQVHGMTIYLRLLQYVKPYWLFFTISMIGFFIFAASQPAFPQLLDYFLRALDPKQTEIVLPFIGTIKSDGLVILVPLGIIIMGIVRGIGAFLGNYFLAQVAIRIVHDLRTELFNQLLKLPCSHYDKSNSGYLVSAITYNVSQVTTATTSALKVVVREGLTVLALLTYLFWNNWQLSLAFITISPIITFIVARTSKRFRNISTRIQNSMGNVTHVVSEYVSGYRTARIFGGEHYEQERFSRASWHNSQQALKLTRLSEVYTPVLQLLVLAAMSILMYTLLYLKNTSAIDMPMSELVAYITAAALLPKPIRQLSDVNADIQRGIAAASAIFKQLDQPIEEDHGTKTLTRAQGKIHFNDVSFSYEPQVFNAESALSHIELTIQPGETIALVGQSGSGKSTLASLLMRFYNCTTGQILLDDTSIESLTLKNLRQQIALVTQNITLFNGSVADNIAYGTLCNATRKQIKIAADVACASEFINKLPEGFDTQVGEDGALLSGGQRQRLALARAILKNAPILILDEATSALDTESEHHIQQALETVTQNRTTLIIAHRLSTIEKADRILVMSQGHIIESGTHETLLNQKSAYARLYHLQYKEEENNTNKLPMDREHNTK